MPCRQRTRQVALQPASTERRVPQAQIHHRTDILASVRSDDPSAASRRVGLLSTLGLRCARRCHAGRLGRPSRRGRPSARASTQPLHPLRGAAISARIDGDLRSARYAARHVAVLNACSQLVMKWAVARAAWPIVTREAIDLAGNALGEPDHVEPRRAAHAGGNLEDPDGVAASLVALYTGVANALRQRPSPMPSSSASADGPPETPRTCNRTCNRTAWRRLGGLLAVELGGVLQLGGLIVAGRDRLAVWTKHHSGCKPEPRVNATPCLCRVHNLRRATNPRHGDSVARSMHRLLQRAFFKVTRTAITS